MRVALSVVVVALVGAACVDSPDLSTAQQNSVVENRIASNRIASNRIASNRIASNRIASNRLAADRFSLNQAAAQELLATPEQRELLQYLIGCAIPPGRTLEANYQGAHYVFYGEVGVAPKWVDRSLRDSEKRWVSACIIARVNNYEISVPISIRGPHEALTVTASETSSFALEEGAFYGDIFRPLSEPIIWVACRGRDQASAANYAGSAIEDRDCAEPDPANPGLTKCGFTYAGDCADWAAPANAYACKQFNPVEEGCAADDEHLGGYYEKCHDAPGSGSWPHATQYKEIITVFLMP